MSMYYYDKAGGKKVICWEEHHDGSPTLAQVIDKARQEFGETPFEQLKLTQMGCDHCTSGVELSLIG